MLYILIDAIRVCFRVILVCHVATILILVYTFKQYGVLVLSFFANRAINIHL